MSPQAAAAPLEVARVRRTIAALREHLAEAVKLLGELYEARAWVTLGLPSWEALCAQELPELGELLSAAERRAVVVALRRGGASLRAAAAPVDVSAATAKTWCDDAGVQLDRVTSKDGRIRPAAGVKRAVKPAARKTDRAVELVAAAGERGLTIPELCKRTGWHWGQASATLCRLEQQVRIHRTPLVRDRCRAYVVGQR